MSAWRDNDPAGTIRLEDADLVEMHSAVDLFAPFPDEARAQKEDTVRGVPHPIHQAPTRTAAAWDLDPMLDDPSSGPHEGTQPRAPFNEVTAVRNARAKSKDREWIDLHAVVDDEGRLRLPENVAKQLQQGAIVEVRVAAWAVPNGVK